MDEHLLDIYARLNLHEFLLEISHANLFRAMPNPHAQLAQFQTDLVDRLQVRAFPVPQSEMGSAIHERAAELAATFCRKVERRMQEQTTHEAQNTHKDLPL